MDVNGDDKLSFNETALSKDTFNKIDLNGDSVITIDEIKNITAQLEDQLSALVILTSAATDISHVVTLSSEVHLIASTVVVTTTSQPVISASQAIWFTSSDLVLSPSSSSVVMSSSLVATTQSLLMKTSPSVTIDFTEIDKELGDELAEAADALG